MNICRGINKPQEKTSWGYAGDVFSEPSFPFCSSTTLPGGGNGPLFFIQLQLGTRLGVWEVSRWRKLDHYPPGVFNFGREVYKCNSRFNFSKSHFGGVLCIKEFRGGRGRGSGVDSGLCRPPPGFERLPHHLSHGLSVSALLGTGDISVLWWEAKVRWCQWPARSRPGPGYRPRQCERPASLHRLRFPETLVTRMGLVGD